MKKSKNIQISVMNVFTGIGIITVLLGSIMLFVSLAVVRGEDGQYALSLFSGGSTKTQTTKTPPSVASSLASGEGESACGFLQEWNFGADSIISGVASSADKLYVLDSGANKIHIIDKKTGAITTIGGPGKGLGQFNNPKDIVYNTMGIGELYIADYGNNRIQAMDDSGAWREWTINDINPKPSAFKPSKLVAYDIFDNPKISFNTPYVGILNEADNTILKLGNGTIIPFTSYQIDKNTPVQDMESSYLDYTHEFMFVSIKNSSSSVNKILKFKLVDGTFEKDWGETGSEEGKFGAVESLAVLGFQSSQSVYANDTKKGVIHVFDFDGKFIGDYTGLYDGVDKYADIKGIFRSQFMDGYNNIIDESIYAITEHGLRKFGTDCAILKITKDFLPNTDKRDFRFEIKQTAPATGHFSAVFSLDDDPNDGALSAVKKVHVPRGLGRPPKRDNPFFIPPAPPATFNRYTIEEKLDYPDVNVSWQCDYGSGNIYKYNPGTSDKGNLAWLNVAWSTGETNCTFFNDTYKGAKIVVIKKVDSEVLNKDEFDFHPTPLAGDLIDFALDDDDTSNTYPNQQTFLVPGGTYRIEERPVPGRKYKTTNICTYLSLKDGTFITSDIGQGSVVTPHPKDREIAKCTFTNTPDNAKGTIIIKKDAVPDSGDKFGFIIQGGFKKTSKEQGVGGDYILNASFDLIDDGKSTKNTKIFNGVDQGLIYTISEISYSKSGYTTSLLCYDSKGRQVSTKKIEAKGYYNAEIKFNDATVPDTITCIFTNCAVGKICAEKTTTPPPGGRATGGGDIP